MENNQKTDNAAFHFFLYLLAFLALGFLATGIGAILFQIINKFFPDVLRYGFGRFHQGAVRYGIASLIVAGPLYLFITGLINKYLQAGKIPESSKVRKWLTYIILFIAAAVIIIDLVTLIFNLLDGELVARFILKVIVVFIIAAAIFVYYFWEIRKKELINKKYAVDKKAFVLLSGIMLIVLLASFWVVDSPAAARDKKVDQQTSDDLMSIMGSIQSYYYQNKKLPSDLSILTNSTYYMPKPLPESQVFYEISGDKSFKLCAFFRRSNLNDSGDEYSYPNGWQHGEGQVCFDRLVDSPDEIKGKALPVPAPVID